MTAKELSAAARDVLAERERQVNVEGWTPAHDDEHDQGEMAVAAACYALASTWLSEWARTNVVAKYWPWDLKWFKSEDSRRNLVKAGALVLAEIERRDRGEQAKHASPMAGLPNDNHPGPRCSCRDCLALYPG